MAKLSAQKSLVNGLREERKLWSQELANQGASLAQDRGRLESQIESLTREVSELQDLYQVSEILHVIIHTVDSSTSYQDILVLVKCYSR